MNYALIGCGRIAANHIKAAKDNNLDAVAICDVSESAMERLLNTNNLSDAGIKRYTDYKAMLDEETPDIIAISTVSGVRANIAKDCLKAGVNLIIEKPMALSIRDADEIIQLAEENNCKVTVCHQNRLYPSVRSVKKAIVTGMIGAISHATVHIRWNRNLEYYSQATWRGSWDLDGGMLMNQCIHCIDLLIWLIGDEVAEVYGVMRNCFHASLETEDVALATVKFKNGVVATIEGTTNVYPANLEETLCVFGKSGTIKLGGKNTNTIELWNVEGAPYPPKDILKANQGHNGIYVDMIGAIKNNHAPQISATDGHRAVELILAVYKSIRDGAPVKLPLLGFSTLDMKGYTLG